MKRSPISTVAALVLITFAMVFAQARPDFSGKWRFNSGKSSRGTQGNTPDMIYPSDLTLKHTAAELQFVGSSLRQADVKAVYKLDGSEVLVTSDPGITERAKATWEGVNLVISSKRIVPSPGGGNFITDIKQVWSLKDGKLMIEETQSAEGLSTTGTFVFDKIGS